MQNNISLNAKILVGFTGTFKCLSQKVPPSDRSINLLNNIIYYTPNPFFTNKIVQPFCLQTKYGISGEINGEIIYKKYHQIYQSKIIILYIHGGAFMTFTYKKARLLTSMLGTEIDCPVVSFDYRCGKKYRYPYALLDSYQVYKWLLKEYKLSPSNIILIGDSAGGNLVTSLISLLITEQSGLSKDKVLLMTDPPIIKNIQYNLPAACVLISPWLDLTYSSLSYRTNATNDLLLPSEYISFAASTYVNTINPPFLASPYRLNKSILRAFPPTLIHICRNEMLFDENITFASKAKFQIKIWDSLPHVFHLAGKFVPESKKAIKEIAEFLKEYIGDRHFEVVSS